MIAVVEARPREKQDYLKKQAVNLGSCVESSSIGTSETRRKRGAKSGRRGVRALDVEIGKNKLCLTH